jgi:hypothetical protein
MGPLRGPRFRSHAGRPLRTFREARRRGRLSATAGCGEHTVRWSPTVTTTQSTRLSEPWWLCDSAIRAGTRTKAVAPSPGRARVDLGDRSSARLGGRRRSSPPWDQHRHPARTTASIQALAPRLQARDARLWRDAGAYSQIGRDLLSGPCGFAENAARGHRGPDDASEAAISVDAERVREAEASLVTSCTALGWT